MKTLLVLTALLIGTIGLNAQTIKVPEFTEKILMLKIYSKSSGDSYLTISDGVNPTFYSSLKLESTSLQSEKNESNVPTVASVLNQIYAQKYKLISSNSFSPPSNFSLVFGVMYVFEKE